MKRLSAARQFSEKRAGVIMVMFALLLVLLFAMLAFAIDIGRLTVLRSEIQNAVDAGAMAGTLKLKQDPTNIAAATAEAERYVQLNRVGSQVTIPTDLIQVEVGKWDELTQSFNPTTSEPDALRVFARQDNEVFSFSKLLGVTTFGAPAEAIATGGGTPLDIMLVLDLSGSMNYQGRIQALRNSAPVFVEIIRDLGGDDQIGMMGLSTDPNNFNPKGDADHLVLYNSGLHPTPGHHVGVLEADLTDNYSGLLNGILSEDNLIAAKYEGWTGTGAALGDAVHYLTTNSNARSAAEPIIVLMSDGYANRPDGSGPEYARSMAQYAANNDIRVFTISLGNDADLTLMGDIASATGALHFQATGSGEADLTQKLTQAFREVAGEIKQTQIVK